MRKLILVLLAVPALSFASPLDMSTLACKNLKLTSATTLSELQDSCVILKQSVSKGRYQVEFINDTTNQKTICHFARNDPAAPLNSCEG